MANKVQEFRFITEAEWDEYEWIDVSTPAYPGVYVRGQRKTELPKDGIHYVVDTSFSGPDQQWKPARTTVSKE